MQVPLVRVSKCNLKFATKLILIRGKITQYHIIIIYQWTKYLIELSDSADSAYNCNELKNDNIEKFTLEFSDVGLFFGMHYENTAYS